MYQQKRRPLLIAALSVLIVILLGLCWYLFDTNVDRSGWVNNEGIYSYRDFHGRKVTGWQEIDGNTYYFDEEKIMTTHWLEQDGRRYYFGRDGALDTGWLTVEGDRYYTDENGVILTGWQDVDFQRYYLDSSGILQTGWLEQEGNTYYLGEDGAMALGLTPIEENTYYFSEEGVMYTGSLVLEEGTYLFREDGTAVTGWLDLEEYRYYFHEDGSMAVGPTRIDGKTYHFSPHGVQIWLVNPWNEIHGDYEVELIQSEGGFRVAEVCFDAFTQMMADMRAAGLNPELASGYRTYWDQFAMYTDAVNKYGTARGSQIAARPNTSEHHLGLAVDILVPGSNVSNKSHEMSEVQQWLIAHCWDYGFILRYPEGSTEITGIIYEPWHYRYVGQEIALELKELGITLEEYLGDWPRD